MSDRTRLAQSGRARIGAKQAATLLQLAAGYVVISAREPYKALMAKGLVEERETFQRGDIEYERKSGKKLPTLTGEGRAALRAYVEKNGRLEVEMLAPCADWSTVIRMDPKGGEQHG